MALTESEKTELKNDILNAIKAETHCLTHYIWTAKRQISG